MLMIRCCSTHGSSSFVRWSVTRGNERCRHEHGAYQMRHLLKTDAGWREVDAQSQRSARVVLAQMLARRDEARLESGAASHQHAQSQIQSGGAMSQPRKILPKKFCQHCSAEMERKRFNGVLESCNVFMRRKYCGRECMALAFVKEDPSRGGYLSRARKQHLKSACETCNTTVRLTIHHVDLNWRNNDPSNLMTLCASCHTTWHHARGHISPRVERPPCRVCDKKSERRDLCGRHRKQERLRQLGHVPAPHSSNSRASGARDE